MIYSFDFVESHLSHDNVLRIRLFCSWYIFYKYKDTVNINNRYTITLIHTRTILMTRRSLGTSDTIQPTSEFLICHCSPRLFIINHRLKKIVALRKKTDKLNVGNISIIHHDGHLFSILNRYLKMLKDCFIKSPITIRDEFHRVGHGFNTLVFLKYIWRHFFRKKFFEIFRALFIQLVDCWKRIHQNLGLKYFSSGKGYTCTYESLDIFSDLQGPADV